MKKIKSENEYIITRQYDAPVQEVWEAWVNPDQVAQWWGPRGFTLTTLRKEVRTGGDWMYIMHGPDGTDYPNHTRFLEVEPLKRMVYDHGGFEDRPPLFRVDARFVELGDKTRLDMTMEFPSSEALRQTQKFIKEANGESTWDRLGEYLEMKRSGKEIFLINRSFQVNIETLFNAWTDPSLVMKWMAPKGFEGQYIRVNIEPGGDAFYSMTGNGLTMYGRAHYLDIQKPKRLVYTQKFVDKDEKVARHPMAPTWPEEMKTTVIFMEEGGHFTRLTIRWDIHGEATETEQKTFKDGKPGMTLGWTGSLDKLEEILGKHPQ